MSAPDVATPGIGLARCAADIVEIVALRDSAPALEQLAAARGIGLAALGRVVVSRAGLALCVRPGRWLLIGPSAAPGTSGLAWQQAVAGSGAAIDLSSGLAAFVLGGERARDMLARGCRLDLQPAAFPPGSAAATIMVQVPVVLAALGTRMLLLTPATTARHLHEWLLGTSAPFGLDAKPATTINELCGVEVT